MGRGEELFAQRRLSPRAERSAVMAWRAIYFLCAAFAIYSTATTAADLVREERTQAAAPPR